MATITASAADPVPDRVPVRRWLAVMAMAVGTFAVVTAEGLPVGLLTSISGALNVSAGTAGLMVTIPGLVAAATAPLLPVAIGSLDRRLVLVSLITLMVVANLACALAPDFAVLLAARFFAGVSVGGFWALAAGLAVRLVPDKYISRATALTFGGATAANVLGIPAVTLIGGLIGWRSAFLAVGGLGVLVAVAMVLLLPRIPTAQPVRLRALPRQFRVPAVRGAVIATFLLVSGHFAAFTFISPLLQHISGINKDAISPLLLAFGVAGIAGTFIAGAAASRRVRQTVIAISVLLAVALAAFSILGRNPAGGVLLLILWGLAFGGVPVSVQMWIIKAAPNATEAATALNTSVYNLAIALGALLGGVVADTMAISGVLWFGAVISILTTLAVLGTRPDGSHP